MASIIRNSYSSLVVVLRPQEASSINGAPNFGWYNPKIMFDEDLGIPGQMLCNIDLQWIRPGSMAPPAYEIGTVLPRIGTLFFDATYDHKILLKAGDKIKTIDGPVEGTFSLRVKPEPAKDYGGLIDHVEVQVVEEGILTKNIIPGVDPM